MQSLMFCALVALGVQLTPDVPNPIKEEMGVTLNRLARRKAAAIARRK